MNVIYRITSDLRTKFKTPIGKLFKNQFKKIIEVINTEIQNNKKTKVISVGDVVSKNFMINKFYPQILIVDNKIMRKKIVPIQIFAEKTMKIRNPPGTITEEAIEIIKEALKSDLKIKIIVEGEEDLLVLIVIQYAPENSYVVYGQPHKGVVLVKVTPEKRREIKDILEKMKKFRNTKIRGVM